MLFLEGEIDRHSVPTLAEALEDAVDLCPRGAAITVDMAMVDFCDSSGLNALLKARDRAGREGVPVRVARPSRQVARLLRLTATAGLFQFQADGAR
ncbi:STAS domain-containing protein [Kitasatospora sp. NPDC085879]|uniref:STAS domain-containing protein n=1 Tax=Kitasatospora sp. NPDC085879 TaxID=3154769 RepID=UPI0015C81959|nr:STAS domain-containing protein [Streptomyces sp. TLI_235]